MLLIEHQVLFLIKDGNLTILKPVGSLGDIFANKELLENRYFLFQSRQFLHQRSDFFIRNTSFEFKVESMNKRVRGSFGSMGFSREAQSR
jgi:hypothetical protein